MLLNHPLEQPGIFSHDVKSAGKPSAVRVASLLTLNVLIVLGIFSAGGLIRITQQYLREGEQMSPSEAATSSTTKNLFHSPNDFPQSVHAPKSPAPTPLQAKAADQERDHRWSTQISESRPDAKPAAASSGRTRSRASSPRVSSSQVRATEPEGRGARGGARSEATTPRGWLQLGARCRITPEVRAWTVQKIKSAELAAAPFPHVYLSEVFQPRFYEICIKAALLNEADNVTQKVYRDASSGRGRYTLRMHDKGGVCLAKDAAAVERSLRAQFALGFWESFAKSFAGKAVTRAWLMLFRRVIALRLPPESAENATIPFYHTMELNRDLPGYSLGTHTDNDQKWVTTIYYLATGDAEPHLGTALKGLSGGRSHTRGGGRRNKADFDTIEKAHYLPNSVLAFAPCHTSWHAVEYTESVRDTIQGFIKSEGSSMPKATCEIESENFRESSGEKVA
eukprot:CAMPEP_0114228846 /NCGR_PEP_ID=MMETSP0058-20121206/2579_1 /TAXON_ID=36894 /ORGANISM="Pyramimonas parkeae, CCMP726" /LENGTH=451 /DNA_ID=CAMNT_0001339857 /DNA_START=302 /DNA_END=1658 /DNA_ORIENTATION=-